MKKIFNFNNLLVVLSGLIINILNVYHVIYFFIHRPPRTTFMGVGVYLFDYYVYLSYIAQGARGNWLFINQMTTENQPGFWAGYWPYLLI